MSGGDEFEELVKAHSPRLELHPLERDRFFLAAGMGQESPRESGPCLYFGPKGQRCSRTALEGGYCAVHREGGPARAARDPRRVLAAAVTLVVLLWPYLHDVVVEILRWIRSRQGF